jgi:Cu/Ag efflux protein CusF
MRTMLPALALILFAAAPAFADQTEGRIKSVDEEKLTITLEDGKSFKLPGEVDLAGIEPGAEIVINFDKVGEVNQITDMVVYE